MSMLRELALELSCREANGDYVWDLLETDRQTLACQLHPLLWGLEVGVDYDPGDGVSQSFWAVGVTVGPLSAWWRLEVPW